MGDVQALGLATSPGDQETRQKTLFATSELQATLQPKKVSHRLAGPLITVDSGCPTNGSFPVRCGGDVQKSRSVSDVSEKMFAVGHSQFARLLAYCPTEIMPGKPQRSRRRRC